MNEFGLKNEFGLHVTIDASRCDKEKLVNYDLVYDLLTELPGKIDMTRMTLPYVCKWHDKFASTPGISGFVMLAESHISVHTFPDYEYVFIDIFSCRYFDTDKAARMLTEAFGAQKHTKNVIKRGLDFPQKVYPTPPQAQKQ